MWKEYWHCGVSLTSHSLLFKSSNRDGTNSCFPRELLHRTWEILPYCTKFNAVKRNALLEMNITPAQSTSVAALCFCKINWYRVYNDTVSCAKVTWRPMGWEDDHWISISKETDVGYLKIQNTRASKSCWSVKVKGSSTQVVIIRPVCSCGTSWFITVVTEVRNWKLFSTCSTNLE
jgi:hypothetical protein